MIFYLPQFGFHPVAVVGKLVKKEERDSYIQEKQCTKQYKNREYRKQITNIKRILKREIE